MISYPTSISKVRIPRAHQSHEKSYPLAWTASGERYSGVPHNVHVLKDIRREFIALNNTRNEFDGEKVLNMKHSKISLKC